MKNRGKRLIATFLVLLTVLTFGVTADQVYTTKDDPLVSLSYVNDVLGPQIMQQVLAKIDAEYIKISDIGSTAGGSYALLTLAKGETLMASTCCEVVVLSGTATTVVTSAANLSAGNGISDLTVGTVLINGKTLPTNHYLVIPKPDGRGFTVSSTEAVILIRGEYNVTK